MKITKTSPLTCKENTMDIDITEDELYQVENRRMIGKKIQDIIPHISKDQREFLMSGYTQDDWDTMFGKEEDDEPDASNWNIADAPYRDVEPDTEAF